MKQTAIALGITKAQVFQRKPSKQPSHTSRSKKLRHIKAATSFSFMGSSGAEIVTIDVHAAKDLIKSGYGYLDVRTQEEHKKGHIEAAKIFNIPYMLNTPEGRVKNPQFLTEVLSACNKEDRLVVGCQSGVRSLSATSDLHNAGFKHVSNMGGGYLAWVENGFSIEKPKEDL